MIMLILAGLYVAYVAVSIFFVYRLIRAFRLFRMKTLTTDARFIDELPSVSVCIPARNETHAMTRCLESVIASRYPKLEIIVLDDESADNTSYLIKSFAHAGVRFVAGSPLPDGWLGKNHALEMLLREASGSYVLYMDVDTQLRPDSIGQLVAYIHKTNASMLSVAPMRSDGLRGSMIFSTLRYFWEMIFHTDARPATASAAWMIHRHTLLDALGGFAQYSEKVQPESVLARIFAESGTYRFLISTRLLGVQYEKKWLSQCETSRRLLYPKFSTVLGGALTGVLLYGILLSPLVAVVSTLSIDWTLLHTLYVAHVAVYMFIYSAYTKHMWVRGWWFGFFVWPVVVLQDFYLFASSTYGYMRGTITWKGRPVRRESRQPSAPTNT